MSQTTLSPSDFAERVDATAIGYQTSLAYSMIKDRRVSRVCVPLKSVGQARLGEKRTSCVITFPFGGSPEDVTEQVQSAILAGVHEVDIALPVELLSHTTKVGASSLSNGPLDSYLKHLSEYEDVIFKWILHTDHIEKTVKDPLSVIKFLGNRLRSRFPRTYHQGRLVLKTCTGYGPGGATPEVVTALVSEGFIVKASGGIRTEETFQELLDAGACLFGMGYSSFIKLYEKIEEDINGKSHTEGSNQGGA